MSQGTRTHEDQNDERKNKQEGESQQEDKPAHHADTGQLRQRFDDGSYWDEELVAFLKVKAIRQPADDPMLLQAALTTACQKMVSVYGASAYSDSMKIERAVVQQFGDWLLRYPNLVNKDSVLEFIVMNMLINAEMEERSRHRAKPEH